jgi:hypothetical protein
MDHEPSQQIVEKPEPAKPAKPAKIGAFQQAVTGVTPPQLGEAKIREVWPTVVGISHPASSLAKWLIRTVFLAPLGWLLLAPLFARKFAPFLARRYTLTNRRLMIQRGIKPHPSKEIALADIDDVRLDPASFDAFYLSGTLEVISKGQVALKLIGVPEPEGFRHAIVNAYKAWVPGKATGPFQSASEAAKV